MTHADSKFVPLPFERLPEDEMLVRSRAFHALLERRRSVRHFTDEPVPDAVLAACIRAAGTAPSGAHKQPWTFVVVRDPELKRKIRVAAEEEEHELYTRRISDEWRSDLAPLGTDEHKPFLETVPALVVVFRHVYGIDDEGDRTTNYYTQESVGIALGMLIAALHNAGLATLTHTPSPMAFLAELLERPKNEKAYVLLPVGFPTPDCQVPDLARKSLDEISTWL